MLTLIQHGDVYTPDHAGVQAVLLAGATILKVGAVDEAAVRALDAPCETIDATGCLVVPGFIAPHAHVIGAGGESGFASRTPPVSLAEVVRAGVTTIVGCLGTDTTTRHLTELLGRV